MKKFEQKFCGKEYEYRIRRIDYSYEIAKRPLGRKGKFEKLNCEFKNFTQAFNAYLADNE